MLKCENWQLIENEGELIEVFRRDRFEHFVAGADCLCQGPGRFPLAPALSIAPLGLSPDPGELGGSAFRIVHPKDRKRFPE